MSFRHGIAGGDVETVDLTLSSPSPEPQPRPQPRHQHPVRQRDFKGESGVSPSKASAGPSHSSRTQTDANAVLPLPSISTHHLRLIINTTPPRELGDLLLELCKSSPALSGAVVRGLAPHSTWAQETIKDYKRRNGLAQVKSEQGSSSSATLVRPSVERYGYGQPRTPPPKAHVKHEVDTLETDSDDTLSDLEVLSAKPSRSSNYSDKTIVESCSSNYRAANARTPQHGGESALSVRIKPEPKATASTCIQCNQTIRPGSRCRFHLGRKKIEKRGSQKIQTWSCCNQPLSTAGCCAEDHIPLKNSGLENTSTPTGPKKPRLI